MNRVNRLSEAIKAHTEKRTKQEQMRFYGRVIVRSPLQIELLGQRVVLTEANLVVTQWVRRYEYEHGLAIGDTVVVDRMPNDDFLVSDVVSTNNAERSLDVAAATTVSLTSRNGHIIRSIPVKDEAGNIVCLVPGYTSLSSDGAPT